MNELQDVPRVIVLTDDNDRQWVASNIRQLRVVPAHYENVEVIDWDKLATQCRGHCLYRRHRDHLHLTPRGQQYYSQLILDAVNS